MSLKTLEVAVYTKAGSISEVQDGGGNNLSKIGNNSGFYFKHSGAKGSIEQNGATLLLKYPGDTAIPQPLMLAIKCYIRSVYSEIILKINPIVPF